LLAQRGAPAGINATGRERSTLRHRGPATADPLGALISRYLAALSSELTC
jgi:hypothetical protein